MFKFIYLFFAFKLHLKIIFFCVYFYENPLVLKAQFQLSWRLQERNEIKGKEI